MSDGQAMSGDTENEELSATPWHFKLLVLALFLYLGYRLLQLIVWLSGKIF